MEILALIAIVVAASFLYKRYRRKARRETLLKKYKNPVVVDRIMRKMFWQGQTNEQLLDSLGRPADIDKKVMKSKIRETWKYHRQGRNRFRLRVTVENDVVIGWDKKS